ncbi:MAG: hypothetical protein EOP82_02990 [Variovorax sp.]|nr:MAG: hypothetical protein EOP82_02990 [Variovorax sp.]
MICQAVLATVATFVTIEADAQTTPSFEVKRIRAEGATLLEPARLDALPEQEIRDGEVVMRVVETRIGRVSVTGNTSAPRPSAKASPHCRKARRGTRTTQLAPETDVDEVVDQERRPEQLAQLNTGVIDRVSWPARSQSWRGLPTLLGQE